MNDKLINIYSDYVQRYLIGILLEDIPYEYYWMNVKHPECVIDDMSDYEIAYRYPYSGERLILDCWGAVHEYNIKLTNDDWEPFILFTHKYIIKCLKEIYNNKEDEDNG